jgi:hypothetical protein
MRLKKISTIALVVAAACLSLSACDHTSGANASDGGNTSASPVGTTRTSGTTVKDGSAASPQPDSTASTRAGTSPSPAASARQSRTTARRTTAAVSPCRTSNLGVSVASTGVNNEIVVNLKNRGASACSLHGFPGVKLLGAAGSTATPDAAHTDISPDTPPTVTIGPGEESRFLLDYIPAPSRTGRTYTRLSVTPPNQTVAKVADLNSLTITIAAPSGYAPDMYVDPIGYHVGYGK